MIMLIICFFGLASIILIRRVVDRIEEKDFTGLLVYAAAALGCSFSLGLTLAIALAG